MSNISVTWHGHSCFSVSCNGFSVVLDPYAPGSVPGLAPLSLTADLCLCSHGHSDHGYTAAVAVNSSSKENSFRVLTIDTFHDNAQGSLRGANRIHILEADGLRIAHMGDIGCALTPLQMEQLKNLDVILVPVGGYYTIDAAQAHELVSSLSPRVTIPMHYRSDTFGYPVIGCLDEYTRLCDDVIVYDTNTLLINENTKKQTAVLKLR